MIEQLHAQNFKAWHDTGQIRMAPLTGFFGTNSSGKTAILQLLLMLKQTVETSDRQRVLNMGDEQSYVNLGTFYDIVHKHQLPGVFSFSISWTLQNDLIISEPESVTDEIFLLLPAITFKAKITGNNDRIDVESFSYSFTNDNLEEKSQYKFGMGLRNRQTSDTLAKYEIISEGYQLKRNRGQFWPLPPPVKSYGFPDRVYAYYQNADFLSALVLAFEELFQNVYYLGPLRDYPRRSYLWSGQAPQDVGQRGEFAVAALLASRSKEKITREQESPSQTVEERVAEWLRELGLIDDFRLQPIAPNRQDYEVRVRRSPSASEVLITDVGFGVSQILPVLVLCYYVPTGSTILLEQPEIHLHPSVQAGLADVFIDVIKTRNVQIILESHSEHLLRRLQRRIAEEQLSHESAALYFCETGGEGVSQLTPLQLDEFGNIKNWPQGFFGDEFGDLAAKTEAEMRRRLEAQA